MRRFTYITRATLVLATLLALLPLGHLAAEWGTGAALKSASPARSTDWARWEEHDGTLVAGYVHPGSPAAQAGLRKGDILYMFDYHPYHRRAALRRAVANAPLGKAHAYYVFRKGQFKRFDVRLTPPPAFLYPLSPELWRFSLWGFTFGAFFHLLGLVVVGPLARRSRRARFSLLLLATSSLWIFSTMLRLLLVETFGVPTPGGTGSHLMAALGMAGALGWVAFPALLLHKVAFDTQEAAGITTSRLRYLAYLPPAALMGTALLIAASPAAFHLGALYPLVGPLLVYVCCYVAAAAVLALAYLWTAPAGAPPGSWSDTGSAFLLASAALVAVLVLRYVPFLQPVSRVATGWLIVSAQLLSTVPVALVTLATLRHGKLSGVLTRALVYLAVLGAIFFAFVGGFALIDASIGEDAARSVIAGLFVVVLLLVFERIARRLQLYATRFFATGPQRTRKAMSRFQEQMRTILTHEELAQQTVAVVGEAFGARSVRLFLRAAEPQEQAAEPQERGGSASRSSAADSSGADFSDGPFFKNGAPSENGSSSGSGSSFTNGASSNEKPSGWISGAYHPEPPYLTDRVLERLWPYMEREGRVWARNAELSESTLPEGRAQLLEERGIVLAVPIIGDGEPVGLLAMGAKKQRGHVYNLADLDLLRSLGGQLALAAERLDLVARERTLIRASAEAELAALRAQINPHFLFNALNTIASLITARPEEAEATVERLAALFRHILQASSRSFVPLEDELALVRHYLRIEQARFGETLAVEVEVAPSLRHHPVPAFAVQTLAENAVKHGIARKRGGGRVRVEARRVGRGAVDAAGAVEVVVSDTGAGIPALFPEAGDEAVQPNPQEHGRNGTAERRSHPSFFGVGLRNVADRLERLYERTDLLCLRSAPDRGTTARMMLPPASPESEDARSAGPPEVMRSV